MESIFSRAVRSNWLAATGIALTMNPAFAMDLSQLKKTYTYKTVGALEIKADVYAAASAKPRPVIMWIHGGALIVGHREQIDRKVFERLLETGYAVVSIDYRLAPQVKVSEIQDDVRDAYSWIREKGPGFFGADPKRIAVMGGSAGGYLTLSTGHRLEPRPVALVTFWGYGDIAADWYAKPDAHYRKQPLVSKEDAYKSIEGPVITGTPGKNDRGKFYLYCRQQGLWTNNVAAIDPIKDPKSLAPYCPLRNVTADFPPTLLIHGTADTDVPYDQSQQMDEELGRKGVDHEFITIQDGPHGLRGVKPEVVADMIDRIMAFLKKRLGKAG